MTTTPLCHTCDSLLYVLVPLDELAKGVADRIPCAPDADGFHHARIPQLAATEVAVKHLQNDKASGHTYQKIRTSRSQSGWENFTLLLK